MALYVALAMVLRRKPHSLIGLLPAMWTDISAKYRKLDEVPFTVWMMAQVRVVYFIFYNQDFSKFVCFNFKTWIGLPR